MVMLQICPRCGRLVEERQICPYCGCDPEEWARTPGATHEETADLIRRDEKVLDLTNKLAQHLTSLGLAAKVIDPKSPEAIPQSRLLKEEATLDSEPTVGCIKLSGVNLDQVDVTRGWVGTGRYRGKGKDAREIMAPCLSYRYMVRAPKGVGDEELGSEMIVSKRWFRPNLVDRDWRSWRVEPTYFTKNLPPIVGFGLFPTLFFGVIGFLKGLGEGSLFFIVVGGFFVSTGLYMAVGIPVLKRRRRRSWGVNKLTGLLNGDWDLHGVMFMHDIGHIKVVPNSSNGCVAISSYLPHHLEFYEVLVPGEEVARYFVLPPRWEFDIYDRIAGHIKAVNVTRST